MDMAQLMELLNERRGDTSYEEFANQQLNMRGSTFWRYDKGQANIGIDGMRRMARWFFETGDAVILGAMAAYALNLNVDMDSLERIGTCILESAPTLEQSPS